MHPADELAEEVSYEDEDVGNIHVKSTEVRHVKGHCTLIICIKKCFTVV